MQDTRNLVSAADFIKAVNGESFTPGDGLSRKMGAEIKRGNDPIDPSILLDIKDDEVCVVLDNAELKDAAAGMIMLEYVTAASPLHLIFVQCTIPSLQICGSNIGQFLIANSVTRDIWLTEESKIATLKISGGSNTGMISVDRQSEIGEIIANGKSKTDSINIHNSTIGYLRASDECILGNIVLSGKSLGGDIMLHSAVQAGVIYVKEFSRSGSITARWKSSIAAVYISGQSYAESIRIWDESETGNVWVDQDSQVDDIQVLDKSKTQDLKVADKSRVGSIRVESNSECGGISIGESDAGILSIEDSLASRLYVSAKGIQINLQEASIQRVRLADAVIPVLVISRLQGELYIDNCDILILHLGKTIFPKDSLFSVANTRVHIFWIDELIAQGLLVLRKLAAIDQLAFKSLLAASFNKVPDLPGDSATTEVGDFLQRKASFVEGIKENNEELFSSLEQFEKETAGVAGLFRITYSSIGKAELTSIDLETFRFEYRDSRLLDMFITSVRFPEKIHVYVQPEDGGTTKDAEKRADEADKNMSLKLSMKIDEEEQLVAIYTQLKKIYDSQGFIVEYTFYHARAMDHQQVLIGLRYRQKRSSSLLFNRVTFRLNKVSNNHGENWFKALVFTLGVSIIFYILFLSSLDRTNAELFTKGGIGTRIGNYFVYLDPTHKVGDLIKGDESNGLAKFLDFFGRMVTGYGIFQFVAAFRRHGRRGG